MRQVAVLGAGISGMATARLLARDGWAVTLLDEYPEPGGNHISRDFGEFTFDIGAIIFTRSDEVAKLFPEAAEKLVPSAFKMQRVAPSGQVKAFPFDLKEELLSQGPAYIARVAGEIAFQKMFRAPDGTVTRFVEYYIGRRLAEDSGLLTYIERFYGLPVDQVAFELASKRMTWITRSGSLRRRLSELGRRAAVKAGLRRRRPPVPRFARPREGFAAMYRPVVARLVEEGVDVQLNARLRAVAKREDGRFVVLREGLARTFDRVISTIPVEKAFALVFPQQTSGVRSLSLLTLCVIFRGERKFDGQILYNYHPEGEWKRLTMHSDVYGKVKGWEFFNVEVPVISAPANAQRSFDDFRRMTEAVGIFDGEMRLAGSLLTDFAYPLYDEGAMERREAALARLHDFGIETVGRQGNFDYIPNASLAINLARARLEESAADSP